MTSELHDITQRDTAMPPRCNNTSPHAPISNIDVNHKDDTITNTTTNTTNTTTNTVDTTTDTVNTTTNMVNTTTNEVDTTINTVDTTTNTVDTTITNTVDTTITNTVDTTTNTVNTNSNTVDTTTNKVNTNSKKDNTNSNTVVTTTNKVNTTTNKVKRKNKVGKSKKNILHCAANANPEKLVSTILKNNYWLTDEHMDHGQWLISKQFPKMKGFHSVLAFKGKTPKVEKGLKDFVQIVNIGGNHWVTVTNTGCEENRIKVYDTLYRSMSNTDKITLTKLNWQHCLIPAWKVW
jgi:hypothetical protein